MRLNIPTWITLFRIVMVPFFVLGFYLPFKWAPLSCTFIFILASVTDWLDGFLARRWKQVTRFGAFLDPVADKIMITAALVLIAEYFSSWWTTVPVIFIITREIIISALREWMAELGRRKNVSVSWIGKIKTTVQMLALIALLWRPDKIISVLGIIALQIAALLTFWSMFRYLHAAWHNLFER